MSLKQAPKGIRENIAYRKDLFARAAEDIAYQEHLWIRCARDPIFYCDSFLTTYNPNLHPDNPYRPFILWPYQEKALLDLCHAIGRHDVPIKKSRDAGASWLCLLAIEHRWHFRGGQTFLLVSRVADLVDEKNNPDSLFWKIDCLHQRQPQWLLPRAERQLMKLYNLDNGSTINGCSTTADAGRGGRRTGILLDEFAAVDDGFAMLKATAPNTRCRIMNSTPKGCSGAYADRLEKTEKQHPERVITMHWSGHPLKRAGLYRVNVDKDKNTEVDIIDKGWHEKKPSYKFVTSGPFFWNGELRSPWYDEQCERAASPQEIAQELDMKMAESAYQYFDNFVLTRLRESHTCEPFHRGEIIWDGDDFKTARWDETPNGRVKIWFHPDAAGRVVWSDFVAGCDVGTGKGGDMSTNSVCSATRSSTGENLLEFAVNTLSPYEFCDYTLAICWWLNKAYLIYEDQGPGVEFTRRLREGSIYPNVYRRDADEKTITKKKTKKLGFFTTPQTKQALLADFRSALATGRFVTHSDDILVECGQYEVLPTGEIQHSKALAAQDPNARGRNHGDRVIAGALSWRGIQDRGGQTASVTTPLPAQIPTHCALARRQERDQRRKRSAVWS